VKPKPGIFVETIRYLLVLTTPVEVVVLGVSFSGDSIDGEMILQPTALSVPSDEVNMLQVLGTPQGRIFMCGNDGNLYELDYQNSGGWFSKKCRKRNHTQSLVSSYLPFISRLFTTDPILELRFDATRNILYALTSNSCIHGYWLGADGTGLSQFASRSNLQNDASVKARIYGPNTELKIVSIFPVSVSESNRIHLIAICSSGVRLYFTTSPSYSEKPYALHIVHVDHPVRDMRNRTCKVQQSFFAFGCLLMAADMHPDTDQSIFALHFDMASKEQGSAADEPCATIKLSGTTWAIEEAAFPAFVNISPELLAPPNIANELATQHFVASRKLLCLTNNGLYTIERRRPLDQLVAILGRSQGNIDSSEELKMFFSFFGEAEACAMCLTIACCYVLASDSTFHRGVTSQIRDWATAGFLYLGGNTPERSVAYFGAQAQYSDRYNGFGLYFTRLLQPVWQLPINRITAYSPDELRTLRDNLSNLLAFVEQTRFASNPHSHQQQQQQQQQQDPRLVVRVFDNLRGRTPNHVEQTNLSHLVLLLLRCCEALNMLIVLNEHDVTIIDQISSDRAITGCLFSDFVSTQTGVRVTNLLIAFLIKAGASEQHEADEIIRQLSVSCPLFFNQNDREHFSGVKKLREAALLPQSAREEVQAESLVIFRKVAASLSFSDVFAVIEEMREQEFYAGMVEVALLASQSREKQHQSNLDDRFRCYEYIVKTLEHVSKSDGDASKNLYRQMKKLVLREGNEECLRYVFGWYLQQGLHVELLDVESPLLENYLRATDLTFLAEYYTANHRFGEAASAYVSLAETQGPSLDLNQRIVFLGHALANVKQADNAGHLAEAEVRQLMEKAEVAQIQRRIYNELQSRHRPMNSILGAGNNNSNNNNNNNNNLNESTVSSMTSLQNDLARLNAGLFTISDLYNQFAWPHQLWETCLVIMYTANHECPRNLVDKIWRSIVQQERRNMRNMSFVAIAASLSRKVEHVGKLSSLSLKVFPVDTVCELLEQVSFELRQREGFDGTWVPVLFSNCGISFNTLYDLYHHLLVSTDDRAKQVHYSLPLRFIVEQWIASVSTSGVPSTQIRTKRLPFAIDDIILRLEECPEAKLELAKWVELKALVAHSK
jgi:nuclear pore complex protein Nup155